MAGQAGVGHHQRDAGHGGGGGRVDDADPAVGNRGADEIHEQLAVVGADVVEEERLAGDVAGGGVVRDALADGRHVWSSESL